MRFLFIILSIIWLMFAWVSFEALRWRPPLQPPPHAQDALEVFNHQESLEEKNKMYFILMQEDIPDRLRARAHFRLAYIFWVETYIKSTRAEQMVKLKESLGHCLKAVQLVPSNASYIYAVADLYHQMKEFHLAEKYYLEAIELDPNLQVAKERYEQLKEDRL